MFPLQIKGFACRKSRRWALPTLLIISVLALYGFNPTFVYFYESQHGGQRPLGIAELTSWVVAVSLVLAMLPRYYLWDTLGERRVAYHALAGAFLALFFPCVLYLAIRVPDEAMEAGMSSLPILGNVLIVCSLAVILFSCLGVVGGGLVWISLLWVIVDLQARNIALKFLPLTWTWVIASNGDATFDMQWRWPWIIVLPPCAMWCAYETRMVPRWARARL